MLLKHPEADRNKDLDDAPLILGRHEQLDEVVKYSNSSKLVLVLVNVLSVLWIAGVILYVEKNVGWSNLWQFLPHEIGGFFAGVFAPLAFLWLFLAYIKRGQDNKLQGNALDTLMRELGYPSPEAEARVASLTRTLRRHAREVEAETANAATKLQEANAQLGKQHQIAGEAASSLIANTDHFQGELDRRVQLVGQLIDDADRQKTRLDGLALEQADIFKKAAEEAESKSDSINTALSAQIAALEQAVAVAEDKTARMTLQLEQTSQDIATVASHTLDRAETAGAGLSTNIHKLDETSEEVRIKLDKGADHLMARARDVENLSRTAAKELTKVSDALLQNTSDLSLSSEDALTRLGTVRDMLSAGASDVERSIESLEERQARFREAAEETGREVRHASDQLVADTGKLSLSVQDMSEEMTAAGEKMRHELGSLEDTYKRTEISLSGMEAVLQQGHTLLQQAGEDSLRNAGKLKGHMADHADDLQNSNDIAEQRTAEIQQQLRKQMNSLSMASKQIQDMSLEISARLEANVDTLSEASLVTSNQVIQVGSGFQRQAEDLKSTAEKVSAQIKDASEELRRETNDIELNAERTSNTLKTASEDLEKKQRALGATADLSKAKLLAAVEEAVRHHQDFLATAERATLQARQSGEAAHSQSAELAKTAERASVELRAMGDQATRHLEELSHAVSKAGSEGKQLSSDTKENIENLTTASDAAKIQLAELSDISERARNYAQTMDKTLRHETAALTEVARQLADKAEMIDKMLADRSQLLEQSQGKADIAGDAFRRKTVELAKASELMLTGLQHADQALGRHKQEMENTRQRVQNDLENVMVKMTEANRQAHGMSEDVAQSLQNRALDLIKFTDQANTGSKEIIEQFDQQKKRLEVTTQQVENSIGETSKILKSESQNLREVAGLAAEEALITSLKFQKQADRLKETSLAVQKQSENISSTQKAESEASIRKAASFLVDSLHSLSIDLSRNLDNTLPEELWKRYRRGEKSIFTRRLLKNKEAEKIRTLYRNNGEFRRYADQYRSDFERLIDETENAEFSELLMQTYTSSDVGKVYLILSDALETNS